MIIHETPNYGGETTMNKNKILAIAAIFLIAMSGCATTQAKQPTTEEKIYELAKDQPEVKLFMERYNKMRIDCKVGPDLFQKLKEDGINQENLNLINQQMQQNLNGCEQYELLYPEDKPFSINEIDDNQFIVLFDGPYAEQGLEQRLWLKVDLINNKITEESSQALQIKQNAQNLIDSQIWGSGLLRDKVDNPEGMGKWLTNQELVDLYSGYIKADIQKENLGGQGN